MRYRMHSLPSSLRLAWKFLALLSFLLTCTVLLAAQDPARPVTPENEEKAPVAKSTVKGRVVYEDSEKPVRRAPINLIQLSSKGNIETATDRAGKFVIKNVPAGRYYVFVDSPGIITPVAFI